MKTSLKNISIKAVSLLFVSLFTFSFPALAHGATLFMVPQNEQAKAGQTFSVMVDLDSQGSSINTASADINYDNNLLSIQSVGYSSSIFSIWAEEPKYSNVNGILHFSGGLPSPGWNGSSGSILSITFKAKVPGQAKVNFENGSVLANDGVGTDVLTSSNGLSVGIGQAAAIPKAENVSTSTEATTTSQAQPAILVSFIPILTDIPDQLTEGSVLSFNGTGIREGQVLVYIQKGRNDPEVMQINTDKNGGFVVTYKSPVLSGYYKIWATEILPGGVISGSSEISYIEVVSSGSFNFDGIEITYKTAIVALLAMSLILLVLWVSTLIAHIAFRHKKIKEVAEAKATLHKGFDTLKTGINSYIKYLTKSSQMIGAKKKEDEDVKENLENDLLSIERKIEKGINDIKNI